MVDKTELKNGTSADALTSNAGDRRIYASLLVCGSVLVEVIPPVKGTPARLFPETAPAAVYATLLEHETGYPISKDTFYDWLDRQKGPNHG